MSRFDSPSNGVLSQLLEPIGQIMPREFARELASLKASPETQARLEELAERNTEGELSDDERAEYLSYVDAIDMISLLQAKARSAMARQANE